jgi:hypothetical protein
MVSTSLSLQIDRKVLLPLLLVSPVFHVLLFSLSDPGNVHSHAFVAYTYHHSLRMYIPSDNVF